MLATMNANEELMDEATRLKIDCTDCAYALKIGDGVKRSLIKHFRSFFDRWLTACGYDATDANLFNQNSIDVEAWHLASVVIERAETAFWCDQHEEEGFTVVPAPEYLASCIADYIRALEDHFIAIPYRLAAPIPNVR